MRYLPTSEVGASLAYPYGRLRTTAYFSVEFKQGKGFRSVFQTINPKTGKLNQPKKGTYAPIMVVTEENGFFKYEGHRMHGTEELNTVAKWMNEHFDLFTSEQIEDIYIHMTAVTKASAHAVTQYRNAGVEETLALVKPAVEVLVKGIKSKGTENVFAGVTIDNEAWNKLGDPNYNPFRIKNYGTI